MLDILIIGHGAIASYVAKCIRDMDDARLVCVICREGREQNALDAVGTELVAVNAVSQISCKVDLAIDCAGHQALRDHGAAILEKGIDLMTVSVGALTDDGLAAHLDASARKGKARLQLLTGAIGGIDALSAARVAGLDRVVYRGRKPPAGWKGSPADKTLDLETLAEPACHFSGSARQAAALYPKNANVAATVALAGLGLDETQVELIADPALRRNVHEIEAEGAFGKLHLTLEGNALSNNPKSSALTAMSIVEAVRKRLQTRFIG